jgi:hypothetical protein
MDRPKDESEKVSESAGFVCPGCGADGVTPMVRTSGGSYCQCKGCGHIWHDERHPAQPSSPQRRRKTD